MWTEYQWMGYCQGNHKVAGIPNRSYRQFCLWSKVRENNEAVFNYANSGTRILDTWQYFLLAIGYATSFNQIHYSIAKHFRMNSKVGVTLQWRKHSVRNVPDTYVIEMNKMRDKFFSLTARKLEEKIPICKVAPFSTKLSAISRPMAISIGLLLAGYLIGSSSSTLTMQSKWETWIVPSPKVLGILGFTWPMIYLAFLTAERVTSTLGPKLQNPD